MEPQLSVFLALALFVFALALFLSPLYIWKWTKATQQEVNLLRKQVAQSNKHLERMDAFFTGLQKKDEENQKKAGATKNSPSGPR